MSEQRSGQEGRQGQSSTLHSDRGSTNISDTVVQKIAGIAAQEVEKVRWAAAPPRRSPATSAA